MEEKQPYIVHLTGTQKSYLVNVMEQNQWKDTLLHKVDCDLSFLVDFLVAEDKRQIYLFKEVLKEALLNQRLLITQNDGKMIEESNSNTDRSEVISKHFADSNTKQSWDSVAANTAEDVLDNVVDGSHVTETPTANCENDYMYILDQAVMKNHSSLEEDEISNSSECVLNNSSCYTNRFSKQMEPNSGKTGNVIATGDIGHSELDSNILIDPRTEHHVNIIENANKPTLTKHQEKDFCVKKEEKDEVFVCIVCKTQFVDKYTLNRHQVTMHNGDPKSEYQCDLCGATMRHKGSLVQHMKSVHSEDRPHRCDVCSSSFKLYQQLKTHKRRHGQDFVETCMVCGKTVTKGHLNSHMKRHTDHRKFKCNTCGKAFHSKQDLDRHVLLHSGDRPNKCPYCEYRCAYKGNLTKHMANRHEAELHMYGRSGKHKDQPRQESNKKDSKTSESTSNINVELNSGTETSSKPVTFQLEEGTPLDTKMSGSTQLDCSGLVKPKLEREFNKFPNDLNRHESSFVSSFPPDEDDASKQTSYHLKRSNIINVYKDFNGML